MAGMKRKGSLGGRALVCGLLAALAGLGTGPARAEAGDQPASPPLLFEMMKPPVPSAEQAMSDAVRERALAPPAASKECVRHPDGATKKKRPSISTALKNVCAPDKPDHAAAPAADSGPPPEKP